ncbi:MAG: hypothetical protein R3B40_31640 [Polyangiales bacterium]
MKVAGEVEPAQVHAAHGIGDHAALLQLVRERRGVWRSPRHASLVPVKTAPSKVAHSTFARLPRLWNKFALPKVRAAQVRSLEARLMTIDLHHVAPTN